MDIYYVFIWLMQEFINQIKQKTPVLPPTGNRALLSRASRNYKHFHVKCAPQRSLLFSIYATMLPHGVNHPICAGLWLHPRISGVHLCF
jgi:hypothetical protein